MRKFLLTISLAAVCAFFLTGCGKKGPPIPPGQIRPDKVADLKKEINGNSFVLSWPAPEGSQGKGTALTGFMVYRSKNSVTGPACADCPLKFEKIADVPASGNSVNGRIQYQDTLENGFMYAYKVIGYTDKNNMSDDSTIIKIIFNGGADTEDAAH